MKKITLLVTLTCLINTNMFSQATEIIEFTIHSIQTPLSVSVLNGATFENLTPGLTYETIAIDDGSMSNIVRFNGSETFNPAQIEIEGVPYSQVIVNFSLPRRLYSTQNDIGFVRMDYDQQSASIYDYKSGNYIFFNPEAGITLTLPGDSQRALIYLGGNPQVTPFTEIGEFVGIGIVIIEYS